MTCLNGLINKRLAALSLLFLLTGCSRAPSVVSRPKISGSVDLDALVTRNPDWSRVAALDAALARLPSTPISLRSAPALSPSLPALSAAAPPPIPTRGEADLRRLTRVRRAREAQRRERLAIARRLELERAREELEREADVAYARKLAEIQRDFLASFGRIFEDRDARWVNLKLQIASLQDIVTDPLWLKALPPTPILDAAQKTLAQKQSELAAYEARWANEKSDLRRTRDARIAAASNERKVSVENALSARAQELLQTDEARLAAQAAQLKSRRDALTRADKTVFAAPLPVSTLGSLTLQSVTQSEASDAKNAQILAATRANLSAQKQRWTTFLYDETRAAALSTARAQGWTVTKFAAPASGVADLTPRMEAELNRRFWN